MTRGRKRGDVDENDEKSFLIGAEMFTLQDEELLADKKQQWQEMDDGMSVKQSKKIIAFMLARWEILKFKSSSCSEQSETCAGV